MKAPDGKTLEIFFLDTVETSILNGKSNPQINIIRALFTKIRELSPILKIGQGRALPPFPLVTHLHD